MYGLVSLPSDPKNELCLAKLRYKNILLGPFMSYKCVVKDRNTSRWHHLEVKQDKGLILIQNSDPFPKIEHVFLDNGATNKRHLLQDKVNQLRSCESMEWVNAGNL